jgi:hypothetical protein
MMMSNFVCKFVPECCEPTGGSSEVDRGVATAFGLTKKILREREREITFKMSKSDYVSF